MVQSLTSQPPLRLVRDFILASGGRHHSEAQWRPTFVESARSIASRQASPQRMRWMFAALAKTRLAGPKSRRGRVVPIHSAPARPAYAAQRVRANPPHHISPVLNELDRRVLKEALRRARNLRRAWPRFGGPCELWCMTRLVHASDVDQSDDGGGNGCTLSGLMRFGAQFIKKRISGEGMNVWRRSIGRQLIPPHGFASCTIARLSFSGASWRSQLCITSVADRRRVFPTCTK
jgi:hypothetical protein